MKFDALDVRAWRQSPRRSVDTNLERPVACHPLEEEAPSPEVLNCLNLRLITAGRSPSV